MSDKGTDLELKCYLLGYEGADLPSTEEVPLDNDKNRNYFNLGRKVRGLQTTNYLSLTHSMMNCYHMEKESFKKNKEIQKTASGSLEFLEKQYGKLCKLIEQNPIIKDHQKDNIKKWEEEIKEHRISLGKMFAD